MDLISQKRAPNVWLALMFSTGLCSLIYELALAQLLGGLTGSSPARFATTLGFYMAGLGLGSVLFKPGPLKADILRFVQAEIALCAIGFLSPFLFTFTYIAALRMSSSFIIREMTTLLVTHLIIFATGFFSGFELPVLSSIAEREDRQSSASVLAADYAGMFAASLLFPLLFLPVFGVITSFWIATLLNLVAAFAANSRMGRPSSKAFILYGLFALVMIFGLVFNSTIQTWLSSLYVTAT